MLTGYAVNAMRASNDFELEITQNPLSSRGGFCGYARDTHHSAKPAKNSRLSGFFFSPPTGEMPLLCFGDADARPVFCPIVLSYGHGAN